MKKLLSIILACSLVIGIGTTTAVAAPPCNDAEALAEGLHEFGLFDGTGVNADGSPIYSLERSATRQEAVVMLIRLLGKETEAM